MTPPQVASVPPVEGVPDDELTLAHIEQHIRHTGKPWRFLLQDDAFQIEIGLVADSRAAIAFQDEYDFPVLSVNEFAAMLSIAKRKRDAGDPWGIANIKAYGEFRLKIHKELGGVSVQAMDAA